MGEFILWQRAEAALVFLAGLLLFWQADSGLTWWLAAILFFAPDLGFAAYAAGNRVGAVIYNLVHTVVFPLVVGMYSILNGNELGLQTSLIWFAHIGMDHLFGYGFKYPGSFKETHFSRI